MHICNNLCRVVLFLYGKCAMPSLTPKAVKKCYLIQIHQKNILNISNKHQSRIFDEVDIRHTIKQIKPTFHRVVQWFFP